MGYRDQVTKRGEQGQQNDRKAHTRLDEEPEDKSKRDFLGTAVGTLGVAGMVALGGEAAYDIVSGNRKKQIDSVTTQLRTTLGPKTEQVAALLKQANDHDFMDEVINALGAQKSAGSARS